MWEKAFAFTLTDHPYILYSFPLLSLTSHICIIISLYSYLPYLHHSLPLLSLPISSSFFTFTLTDLPYLHHSLAARTKATDKSMTLSFNLNMSMLNSASIFCQENVLNLQFYYNKSEQFFNYNIYSLLSFWVKKKTICKTLIIIQIL